MNLIHIHYLEKRIANSSGKAYKILENTACLTPSNFNNDCIKLSLIWLNNNFNYSIKING